MRLVTRGDLDGVTSAVLITSMEKIDSIELIHPQQITDGKFEITENDIMANLPYHPRSALWFDHHELTKSNLKPPENYRGKHALAPSVSRVVYDYYASEKLKKFEHLVGETDRFDSAQLTMEEVCHPEDVILLGFTIDSRTSIGRFKDYFLDLVEWLKALPVQEVLQKPEAQARVKIIQENYTAFLALLEKHSHRDGNVVITDFRPLEQVPIGNRFLVYTLFPEANVSLRLQWGPQKQSVAVTLGHSIFNRTSRADCGRICSDFGGGGHRGAAACPLDVNRAEEQISLIIKRLKEEN